MTRYKWDKEKLELMQLLVEKEGYGYISIDNLKRVIRNRNRLEGITPEEHNKTYNL